MSLTASQLSIDGTAVKIAEAEGMPLEVHIHIASGSLYVGTSNVSTTAGYKLDNGTRETFTVPDGSALYGIANGGTSTVYVLIAIL